MFEVMDNNGKIWKVYAVVREGGSDETYFLLFVDKEWKWFHSKHFFPFEGKYHKK